MRDEDKYLHDYSRLVTKLIRPYFLKGADYDDLYQEGMIGLLKAVRMYDEAKSDNFEAYAALCIKSRIFDAIRKYTALSGAEAQLAETLNAYSAVEETEVYNNPEVQCLANESAKEIRSDLHGLLSAFESNVLDQYLEGYTVTEVAHSLNRPKKSVENAISRIRIKLSKYLSENE